MPKGKGFQIKTLRDEGILSPSEVYALEQKAIIRKKRDLGELTPSEVQVLEQDLERHMSMSPKAIQNRGYKYFPDNP